MRTEEGGRQGNCPGEIYLSAGLLMGDKLQLMSQETHDTSKELKVQSCFSFLPLFSHNLCQGPSDRGEAQGWGSRELHRRVGGKDEAQMKSQKGLGTREGETGEGKIYCNMTESYIER